MKDLQAPSRRVRPRVPTELVSFEGMELLWISAILFVPAIFGVMFLPALLRFLVLTVTVTLMVTYGILYAWARVRPMGAGAQLLALLHIGPKPRITA